ncbi:MAG: hypothetical protein ACI865_001486 [Flavobacteriaceae bacterium]|jgi:hypothetical protein
MNKLTIFTYFILFVLPFTSLGQGIDATNDQFIGQKISAQEVSYLKIGVRQAMVQNQSLYLELAGSGGFGSLNFEWKFRTRGHFRWMLRTGISGSYIDANNGAVLIFPLMVHAVYSPNVQKHSIDFGIGQSPSITTNGSFFVRTPISIGYRLEPQDKRVFYRFSYTPIVSNIVNFQWEHWGGITIGYKLKPHF